MTIIKGGVTPRCENLPAEIEVAFYIVSSLIAKKLLSIRKEMIGEKPCYLWELATEPIIEAERMEHENSC